MGKGWNEMAILRKENFLFLKLGSACSASCCSKTKVHQPLGLGGLDVRVSARAPSFSPNTLGLKKNGVSFLGKCWQRALLVDLVRSLSALCPLFVGFLFALCPPLQGVFV